MKVAFCVEGDSDVSVFSMLLGNILKDGIEVAPTPFRRNGWQQAIERTMAVVWQGRRPNSRAFTSRDAGAPLSVVPNLKRELYGVADPDLRKMHEVAVKILTAANLDALAAKSPSFDSFRRQARQRWKKCPLDRCHAVGTNHQGALG